MSWAIWPHFFLWMCQDKNAKSCYKVTQTKPFLDYRPDTCHNTRHNCGSDMGWVSPGYISFSGSVRLTIIYMYVCVYVCLCMSSSCQTTTPNETHSRMVDTSYTRDDFFPKNVASPGQTSSCGNKRLKMSKMLFAEDLKHDIQTHDDSGIDMGLAPSGHTCSIGHVMLKILKW